MFADANAPACRKCNSTKNVQVRMHAHMDGAEGMRKLKWPSRFGSAFAAAQQRCCRAG